MLALGHRLYAHQGPSVLDRSPVQGMHVCDLIDVFADWQQKSGSRDMQLLMLALLDKEQEMPGGARYLVNTPCF